MKSIDIKETSEDIQPLRLQVAEQLLRENPPITGQRKIFDVAATIEELDRIMVLELIRAGRENGPSIEIELKIPGENVAKVPFGNETVNDAMRGMKDEEKRALYLHAGENSMQIWQHYLDHSTQGHLGLPHGNYASKKDLYEVMLKETDELMGEVDIYYDLIKEAHSMNGNKAMEVLGIDPNRPETFRHLVSVVKHHELGASARAVLVWIRGYLQKTAQTMRDIDDQRGIKYEVFQEAINVFPAASSISRAIPVGLAMQEHLAPDWEHDRTVVIELGASRAHVARVLLHPEILEHEFFEKYRMKLPPERMPKVDQVIAVDNRDPSFKESAQVYMTPSGDKTTKVEAMEELEELGDEGLVKVLKDIRELTPEDLLDAIGDRPANIVIMLNNVLYAVREGIRAEIKEAVNKLAAALDAPIMQMDGWQVFHDEKPEVTLPGSEKPLILPAYLKLGKNFDEMKTVTTQDGNTGKPFLLHKRDGSTVFVDKEGNENAVAV